MTFGCNTCYVNEPMNTLTSTPTNAMDRNTSRRSEELIKWLPREEMQALRKRVKQGKKNVKSHVFLDFQKKRKKRKKRNSNNTCCRPKFLSLNTTLNQICCPLRNY